MTVENLQYLSAGSYALAGVCFVVAVLLFIVCQIPVVIGYLSGMNARKAIENIRRQQRDAQGENTEFCVSDAKEKSEVYVSNVYGMVETCVPDVNETAEICVSEDSSHGICSTTILAPRERLPLVVEYEIGYWTSEEIIDGTRASGK